MSVTSLYKTFGLPEASRSGLLARAATFTGRLVREWRLHRAMMAVEALDDAMLHDIGVGRGSIEDAVRHGRRATGRWPA